MTEKKEAPDAKLSLKYIAWNVKEISENFALLVEEVRKMNESKDPRSDTYSRGSGTSSSDEPDDIPFYLSKNQ